MTKIDAHISQVTAYTGFIGWVLHVFGRTVRVEHRGKTTYYHKDELVNQLFLAAKATTSHLERKTLSTKVLEVLQPIEGRAITTQKVRWLFKSFLRQRLAPDELGPKLDTIKNRKLTVLKASDPSFIDKLKPGDLVFKKVPDNVSNIVVTAQKIFRGITRAPFRDRESYKYSHVAIYLGNGQVAEAMTVPNGRVQLRRINMLDPEFMDTSSGMQFLITRPKDQELAKEAVEHAKNISCDCTAEPLGPNAGKKHPHKYAFLNALRSLWHSSSFGHFAKQRYLKAYFDAKNKEAPLSFVFFKDFFCSNFVTYCFQAAESQKVVPEVLGKDAELPKADTLLGKALVRTIWSRINTWRYSRALGEKVQFQYDAKWITPQDLRHFIVGNPKLFTDKILVS